MTPPTLIAQRPSARRLAQWWVAMLNAEEGSDTPSAEIEVREDALFSEKSWLHLGKVTLRLPGLTSRAEVNEDWSREDHLSAALIEGGYEWELPDSETVQNGLLKSLAGKADDKIDVPLTGRVRDAIGYALLRLGLEMPLLDAQELGEMPFRRPVTLVADTNAVLQGGIDFAVRFLYPMARLRIPEPVHAELSNQAVQYLSSRRNIRADGNRKTNLGALRQRLTSQGGLRALLRVQLQSGVEIERLQVEAEEPRNFDLAGDNKGGDRSAVPDRMILETALRHRALIASGHPVRIMTSDQGLARSALIECIAPLYFPPRKWDSLFGRTYRGAAFAPFTEATSSIWHRIPLTEVLWELAACFGSVRLRLSEVSTFTVTATRRDLSWSPFHAREDLLWIQSEAAGATEKPEIKPVVQPRLAPSKKVESSRLVAPKFSVEKLLKFWSWMAAHREGNLNQAAKAIGVNEKTARDYVRFVASGGFLVIENDKITVDGELFDPLWTALRSGDWDVVRKHFLRFPAFAALCRFLSKESSKLPEQLPPIRDAALPGFQRLGEICGAILGIPNRALVFCEPRPNLASFCQKALNAYRTVLSAESSATPLVQSGAWMEALSTEHKVHPLFAPLLLQEAITARSLDVVFEGSQPSREKADHVFRRVVSRKDDLYLEEISLYRGDYLAADRASVHLKIETSKP